MLKIISSVVLVSVGVVSATVQQGLKTSLDIAVLTQAKDAYF